MSLFGKKWGERYLDVCDVVASWSKDPSTKVGAVCVGKDGQILSQGYNGFPRGIRDIPDRLNNKETKYKYVVHAEMNAIYNATLNGQSLKGSTMFVKGLPVCHECAKAIVQVGIRMVVAQVPEEKENWKESADLATQIFEEAEVSYIRRKEND
jgi:dCMP deaminase